MGLYDRDYAYEPQPGFHVQAPQSLTVRLMLLNVGIYLLEMFLGMSFTEKFVLYKGWFHEPWQAYRLLTYGFLHDPNSLWHIVINMFVLWSFGRQIELHYGRTRFLWMYLTAIVFAGAFWSVAETIAGGPGGVVLGASGGVVAVVILFALNFPHAKGMVFPLPIPIPMWVLAVFLVLMDLSGAVTRAGNVAFTAHLGGAVYGWLFYRTGWTPAGWFTYLKETFTPKRRPPLRVHGTDDDDDAPDDEVDQVLRKIQEHGQDSLTWRERRILERASRDYQNRRRP